LSTLPVMMPGPRTARKRKIVRAVRFALILSTSVIVAASGLALSGGL
jgi:hypothetical protein